MKHIPYLFVFLWFTACGDGTSNTVSEHDHGPETDIDSATAPDTVVNDVTRIETDPAFLAVYDRFKPVNASGAIDTTYIRHATKKYEDITRLRTKDVRRLTRDLSETDESSELTWSLNTFYLLDSLERTGALKKYHETLDIGMMKHSKAYAIDRIVIDPETELLVWGLTYQTYEACPYAEGTTLLGTLVYNGKQGESFYLGEDSHAADPPVGFTKYTSTTLSGNKVSISIVEINTDEDPDTMEPVEEVNKKMLNYIVKEGELIRK